MDFMVSIIVPVYNLEGLISRCLDSVLSQTYEHWECLCVNDGSSDCSGEILDCYAKKDARIRVLHQRNAGVSAARNAGLRAAHGKYIVFIDGDDFVSPDLVQKMIEAAICDQSLGLVAVGYWDCDEYGSKIHNHLPTKNVLFPQQAQKLTAVHVDQSLPFAWAKLYRNSVIKEHGITFDEDAFMGEDTVFDFKYMMYITNIAYIHKGLYMYCHRESSCTSHVGGGRIELNRYKLIADTFLKLYDFIQGKTMFLSREQCYALVLCRMAGVCRIIWTVSRHWSLFRKSRAFLLIIRVALQGVKKSPISLWLGILREIRLIRRMRRGFL